MNLRGTLLSKLLVVVLTLVPIAILGSFAAMAWTYWTEKNTELSDSLVQYDRLRSVAEYKFDDKTKAGPREDASLVFLGQGPQAVLSAALQSRLREMAVKRGVDVVQASDLKVADIQKGITRVGVRLEMSGQFEGMHSMLQEIEQASPWLFVGNIELRSGFADASELQTEPPVYLGIDVWGIVPAPVEDKAPK
jgi:Type II secretion system (T2SS), protein M subtype b